MALQGVLLIDKPMGWTSFDVVNYVRKMVAAHEGKKPKNTKVGHTGTLDPLATGLLVLLVGKEYTRRAGEFSKLDKTYEVTMKLGEVSTTGDEEGEKTVTFLAPHLPAQGRATRSGFAQGNAPDPADAPQVAPKIAVADTVPSEKAVLGALDALQGHIMQTPPVYSAMKVNGQRAYKLARAGKEVKLEQRPVTIHGLKLTKYDYPYVEFTADVSSGTYIRSLVEDLGTALATGAYMSDLRRTRVGAFHLTEAHAPDVEDLLEHIFSI